MLEFASAVGGLLCLVSFLIYMTMVHKGGSELVYRSRYSRDTTFKNGFLYAFAALAVLVCTGAGCWAMLWWLPDALSFTGPKGRVLAYVTMGVFAVYLAMILIQNLSEGEAAKQDSVVDTEKAYIYKSIVNGYDSIRDLIRLAGQIEDKRNGLSNQPDWTTLFTTRSPLTQRRMLFEETLKLINARVAALQAGQQSRI